jgi:hypothetical protein
LNRKIEEAVKQAKDETKAQLKSDEKRMSMLIELGTAAMQGLIPALTEGTGGAAAGLEVAKTALKAASAAT